MRQKLRIDVGANLLPPIHAIGKERFGIGRQGTTGQVALFNSQLPDLLDASAANTQLLLDKAVALARHQQLDDLSVYHSPPVQLFHAAPSIREKRQPNHRRRVTPIR
jgi:hypothetical protein